MPGAARNSLLEAAGAWERGFHRVVKGSVPGSRVGDQIVILLVMGS